MSSEYVQVYLCTLSHRVVPIDPFFSRIFRASGNRKVRWTQCPQLFPFFGRCENLSTLGSVCDRVHHAHHCEGHKISFVHTLTSSSSSSLVNPLLRLVEDKEGVHVPGVGEMRKRGVTCDVAR